MADNEPRKHHYIPQFLLKHFADNDGKVHVFDKKLNASRHQSTKKIAFENDMYVIKDDTGRKNLEELATMIDEFGCEPIRKLIKYEGLSALTKEERLKLSYFVAAMMIRVPHTRLSALATNNYMIDKWGPDICAEGSDVPISAFTEQVAKNMTVAMMARLTPEFAKYLREKIWLLMKAPEGSHFYISDNPVAKHNLIERPLRGNLGLKNEGIEIYLPIAPHLCLMLLCPKMANLATLSPETGVHEAYYTDTPIRSNPDNVIHLNSLQVIHAERFLFSSRNDFHLAQDMIREHPDIGSGSTISHIQ